MKIYYINNTNHAEAKLKTNYTTPSFRKELMVTDNNMGGSQ